MYHKSKPYPEDEATAGIPQSKNASSHNINPLSLRRPVSTTAAAQNKLLACYSIEISTIRWYSSQIQQRSRSIYIVTCHCEMSCTIYVVQIKLRKRVLQIESRSRRWYGALTRHHGLIIIQIKNPSALKQATGDKTMEWGSAIGPIWVTPLLWNTLHLALLLQWSIAVR